MFFNSTLDEFCGSTFWDTNLSWNTDNPAFTPCFEKTVLIWIPCSYLWVAALFDAYFIFNSKERNIPWNILNISKLVITFLLVVLKFVDLGVTVQKSSKEEAVSNADYCAPFVEILTFVLSAKLLHYNKNYGMRTSGVLFFYWLLLILAGIPQLRSEIVMHNELTEDENVQYNFVSYVIYYPLIILMFILNCFADLPPKDTPYKIEKNQCPKNAAGFPSRLTFSWFDPLAFTGFRRSLTVKDLWTLNPEDSSKVVVPRFIKFWERTIQKQEISNDGIATENIPLVSVNFKSSQDSKRASILPALCFTFGGQFFFGALLNIVNNVLMFLPPQFLKLLIEFIASKEPVWKGYLYVGGLFVCATIQTMLSTHFDLDMYLIGMKIRTALTSAIYRKSLRISNSARKLTTVGEIVNLIAVDAQRFLELTVYLNLIWSAPLQMTLALYFLWGILGPSVLAGLAVMIVLIPFNGIIANRMKKMQLKQMKYKDERVKLMNEVLNGIKVLKMYAWEPSFEEQILKIRNKEVYVLKQIAFLNSTMSFLFFCTPFLNRGVNCVPQLFCVPGRLCGWGGDNVVPSSEVPCRSSSLASVSLMSFGSFVLVNDDKVLDSKRTFVALSLFNILRMPLGMLPRIISDLVQTFVSIKRLNRFMNFDELSQNSVEHDPKDSNPIVIEEGHFTWSEDSEPVLRNINLHIPRGGLVAVVGAVGSGKSSLLSALLGEMDKISGRVNTTGTVAYVPQQAWIQNATLQDNILFGRALEKVKYNNVINVCALKPDFEVLPGGDQTEIGEKGINLSGGQKQRVSLARAVYYDADNYFLDDPLSAVDSHVGKHIFDKVIGPNGLLKNKTRVWVTHNVSYLAQTDLVVVLKDGEVSEAGSYQQLLEKNEAFAEFLLHHMSDAEHTSPEELNEINEELESKLERARSLSESTSESEQIAAGDRKSSFKSHTPESTTNELKEKNKLIEAEKAETGSVKWGVYKHYLKSMGVLAAAVTVLMNFGMQVFQVGSNYWLSKWSNDDQMMVNGTVDVRLRNQYLGVYVGLGVGHAITTLFSDLMPHLGCWRAAKILHDLLLTKVLRTPLKFFEVTPIGRILSRFSKDVDIMDSSLPSEVTNVLFCTFEVLGTLFVISYSTPVFLTVVLPIGIVYYVIQRFYVATSRQLKRLESISRSPIYSRFGESITGAQTIRAYGVAERFIEESECGVDFNQSSYYPSIIAHRWLAVRLEMVGNLIIFFSALFVVLGRETINAGVVGLSITYALQVTQTLIFLVRITSEIETNIVAVERIKEYSETKEEAPWTLPAGPDSSWPERGALELERLSLGYRTGEPTLRDLSCSVAPQDKLGIVGRTGAGKSTLTLGLFRIVEAMSGRILIDGIDIATIGLHQLRSRITIIPQDPVLFAGTLRINLDPFGAFGDEDIWRALEHAHLNEFAKGLQSGLMHEISEGGENLSVGQRQLVCLARALLRKTPLLVLDEATAAIDLETDDLIQKTIRSEFASCTVLTIAHRLNTIMDSTRVMVLDKGQLVEYAPPEQLLQDKNSIFYSMAKDAGLVN